MFELLWLLLPLAAASGWFAARRSSGNSKKTNGFPDEDYFRGLNYLLDNRPDKAIEVFLRLLEVNQETVETHLALGNLYRRRGEVDRAIQIHQNLTARKTLNDRQRARALLELGEDYMKAGVFDRAERLFTDLAIENTYVEQALRHLLTIYEQEQDWDNAIVSAHRLEESSGKALHTAIAQYHCEIAERAYKDRQPRVFREALRNALQIDPRCVRASLLFAKAKMAEGRHRSAMRILKQIELQDPTFLPEAIAPLRLCHRALGREEALIDYLQGLQVRHPSGYLAATLAELYREHQGREVAERFLIGALRTSPSAVGLRRLMELKLELGTPALRDQLVPLLEVGGPMFDDRLHYICGQCGFEGRAMHWRCPGCQTWSSIRPRDDRQGRARFAPHGPAAAA